MTRTRTLACGAGLIVLGVAPLAADPRAPSSLRMRAASTADPPPSTDPAPPDGDPPARSQPATPEREARTAAPPITGTLIERGNAGSPLLSPVSVVDRETQSSHGDLVLSHLKNALGPSFTDVQGPHCREQ